MSQDDALGEIERLLDQFTQLSTKSGADMPIDLVETDDELVVDVDLPGRTAEEIDVTLRDSRELVIEAGARTTERDGRYVTRDRATGSVSRSIRLPEPVEEAETEAGYDRGVLTVRLPRQTDEPEGTAIPVE